MSSHQLHSPLYVVRFLHIVYFIIPTHFFTIIYNALLTIIVKLNAFNFFSYQIDFNDN